MIIRPFKNSDRKELLALLQMHIPRYFHASELDDFKHYLENETEEYFVIENDKKIIAAGGINYFSDKRKARLSWDVVHPDFQGTGVGTKLVRFRVEFINTKSELDLIQVRTTQLVFPFYQKLGFELDEVKKDFWAPGFDLYQMKMELKNYAYS